MKQKQPQRSIINCKDRLTSDDVYKGIIGAIRNNEAEISFVVTVEDKQHFTSVGIMPFYDMIQKSSEELTANFNKLIGVKDAE